MVSVSAISKKMKINSVILSINSSNVKMDKFYQELYNLALDVTQSTMLKLFRLPSHRPDIINYGKLLDKRTVKYVFERLLRQQLLMFSDAMYKNNNNFITNKLNSVMQYDPNKHCVECIIKQLYFLAMELYLNIVLKNLDVTGEEQYSAILEQQLSKIDIFNNICPKLVKRLEHGTKDCY